MKEIGKRLKALREGVGLSQNKLAEILGSHQSSINRYEQGLTVPGPQVFVKYADYFNVSMDYIYCRTDKPEGKLYDYKPQLLIEKAERNKDLQEFVDMCFDPNSPISGKLKDTLYRLMAEQNGGEKEE